MVLQLFRHQSAILRAARPLFVAAYSDSSIAAVPGGPLPFNLARWISPFLSSEAMEGGATGDAIEAMAGVCSCGVLVLSLWSDA